MVAASPTVKGHPDVGSGANTRRGQTLWTVTSPCTLDTEIEAGLTTRQIKATAPTAAEGRALLPPCSVTLTTGKTAFKSCDVFSLVPKAAWKYKYFKNHRKSE